MVSAFIFCVGDCPFDPEQIPTYADACREVTGCCAGHQEVGMCSTRCGSWGMYIILTSAKVNKAEPTLALKPRGDYLRNTQEGASGPKIGHVCVSINIFKKVFNQNASSLRLLNLYE